MVVEQIFFSPEVKQSLIISNKLVYAIYLKSCRTAESLEIRKSQNLIELLPSPHIKCPNPHIIDQSSHYIYMKLVSNILWLTVAVLCITLCEKSCRNIKIWKLERLFPATGKSDETKYKLQASPEEPKKQEMPKMSDTNIASTVLNTVRKVLCNKSIFKTLRISLYALHKFLIRTSKFCLSLVILIFWRNFMLKSSCFALFFVKTFIKVEESSCCS